MVESKWRMPEGIIAVSIERKIHYELTSVDQLTISTEVLRTNNLIINKTNYYV